LPDISSTPGEDEGDAAAGLLRAQGIAAEIAPPPIWGDPRTPASLASLQAAPE